MKKIFLLVIATCFMDCNDSDSIDRRICCKMPAEATFLIRLVDPQGSWIEGVEEKEIQLFVADSQWNILEEQPDSLSYGRRFWGTQKWYNYIETGEDEFVRSELLSIQIGTRFKDISHYDNINDETYGDYIVLQIDENTSLNIQLFHKEFFEYTGLDIEKFICNGIEYINLEYTNPDAPDPRNRALRRKTNDIVIE